MNIVNPPVLSIKTLDRPAPSSPDYTQEFLAMRQIMHRIVALQILQIITGALLVFVMAAGLLFIIELGIRK